MNTEPYHNVDIDQHIERISKLSEVNFLVMSRLLV